MFQQYAVTYTVTTDKGTENGATTSTVETHLDPDVEIPKMIACRRFGNADRASAVTITEKARLGDPTETPFESAPPAPKYDALDQLMAYEAGDLDDDATIVLFQHLVDTGQAWSLQGHYGRTARALIDAGHVTERPAPAPFEVVDPATGEPPTA